MSEERSNPEQLEKKYPGNAYTNISRNPSQLPAVQGTDIQKPEEKKKPKAKEVKRTVGERIAESFLAANKEDIKEHLLFDWLIPEIKIAIENMLHMILYGTWTGRRPRDRTARTGYTSYYNSIYDERKRDRERERDKERDRGLDPTRQNFRHIQIKYFTKEDAEKQWIDILNTLYENSSGCITVKEVYSMHDFPTNNTMNRWGWFDLPEHPSLMLDDDGCYVLEMPRAEVIR